MNKSKNKQITPPCTKLNICPYEALIEEFPLADNGDKRRCQIYGHVCPVYFINGQLTNIHEAE